MLHSSLHFVFRHYTTSTSKL